MTELYDTVYPPRTPVVDNFLYGGTYLFVGAPKVGKSFFMAQLANRERLQKRLSRMFGVEGSDKLHFATQANTLNEGLVHQLEGFMQAHPDVRLIIIDTLQKIRAANGDRFSYSNDYEIVTKLKAFSDKYGICLLVVHHTRKLESEDSFDMISGTNGLLGAADGAFIMQKKKRTDNTAIMNIVGRDQQDQELIVDFDQERCIWKLTKAEKEVWKMPPDPVLEAVATLLTADTPKWSGSPSELLVRLPQLDMPANVLTRRLNVSAEQLYNDYNIRYESKRTHSGRLAILELMEN